MDKMSRFRNLAWCWFLAALMCWLAGSTADAASSLELTNRVTVGNFTVSYPDGWSTLQSGRVTFIIDVPSDQQAKLGSQFLFTPQVSISTEQRTDKADALKRLNDLAAAEVSVTSLTVGGSPAIQWQKTTPWPQPGGRTPSTSGTALTISTAIAAGSQLIRLDGSLPSDAPAVIADTIAAIETSVTFMSGSSSASGSAAARMLVDARGMAGMVIGRIRAYRCTVTKGCGPGKAPQ